METEIKKPDDCHIEISLKVSWQEFQPFFERATADISNSAKMKGFRPGKVPLEILKNYVKEEEIISRAAQLAIEENYKNFLSKNEFEILGQPEVEILKLAKDNPFVFKIKAEVMPQISLPDYKKIAGQFKKEDVFIEEKEIEETIDFLKKSRAKLKEAQRPAGTGDFCDIEYSSPRIENGKPYQDNFFLGKGGFVPGFEEKILGMEGGQEKDFSVVFPDDFYKKELAGNEVKFHLKVKKVQEAEFPEVNDEFARSLGNFQNLEDLKKNLKSGILKEKEAKEKEKRRLEILEKVANLSALKIPQKLAALEAEIMIEDLKKQAKGVLNISFEEYLSRLKKDEKELRDSILKEAEKRIKNFLLLKEIGKKEKIEVSEEEVEQEINKILKSYQSEKAAKKEIDLEKLKSYCQEKIHNEKVFEKLESYIK